MDKIQYSKEYYIKNKTKYKERAKEYYEKNKEKLKERSKEYYYKNIEKVSARTKLYYEKTSSSSEYKFKRYGITRLDYNNLYENQRGLCSICGKEEISTLRSVKKKVLAVDHCHTTGKVRGLLCSNCNRGLGHFQESSDILRKAIDYLEKTNA